MIWEVSILNNVSGVVSDNKAEEKEMVGKVTFRLFNQEVPLLL